MWVIRPKPWRVFKSTLFISDMYNLCQIPVCSLTVVVISQPSYRWQFLVPVLGGGQGTITLRLRNGI